MSAPFVVARCDTCGHLAYPPRILCPVCAGSRWGRRLADTGVVEEVTVRRPVAKRRQLPWGNWLDQEETRLASVRTDAGPRVICRVAPGVQVGDRVTLVARGSTAIALAGHDVSAVVVESPNDAAASAADAETS